MVAHQHLLVEMVTTRVVLVLVVAPLVVEEVVLRSLLRFNHTFLVEIMVVLELPFLQLVEATKVVVAVVPIIMVIMLMDLELKEL